eukprot:IDg18062t1
MNQVWFGYILRLEPGSVRSVIDLFKNTRSLITHRLAGAPIVSDAKVIGGPSARPFTTNVSAKEEPTPATVHHFPKVLGLSSIQQARMTRKGGSEQQ